MGKENLEGLVNRGYVPASYEPGDHLFIMPSFFSTMGDLQEGIRTLSEVTMPNEVPKLSPMYCETVPVGKAPPNWEFEAVKHAGASPYFLLAERDESGALIHQHLFLVDNGNPIKQDMPEWLPSERANEYLKKLRVINDTPALDPEPKKSTNIRMPAANFDSDPIDLQAIEPESSNSNIDALLARALGPDDVPPLAPESQQVPMPPPGQTTEIRALYTELDKQEKTLPLPLPPPPPPLQPEAVTPQPLQPIETPAPQPMKMDDVAKILDEVLPDDTQSGDTEIIERDTERGVRFGIPTERVDKSGITTGDTIIQHFGGKEAPIGDQGLPTEMETPKERTNFIMPNPLSKKKTEEVAVQPEQVVQEVPVPPVVQESSQPAEIHVNKPEVPMPESKEPVQEKPKRGRFAMAVGAAALALFVGYLGGRAQGGLPSTEKTFSVKEMNEVKSNYENDFDAAKSQYQRDSDLLKKDLERLNAELKSAQSALESEKSSSTSSAERVKSLESNVSKLQSELDKRQKEFEKKSADYDLLERALKNSENNADSLRSRVSELEKRIAAFDKQVFSVSASVECTDANVYALALGYLSALSEYQSVLNKINPDSDAAKVFILSRVAGLDNKLSDTELEKSIDEFVISVNNLRLSSEKPYSKLDIKADYSKKPKKPAFAASLNVKMSAADKDRLSDLLAAYKPADAYKVWAVYLASKDGALSKEGVDRIERWLKADYKK